MEERTHAKWIPRQKTVDSTCCFTIGDEAIVSSENKSSHPIPNCDKKCLIEYTSEPRAARIANAVNCNKPNVQNNLNNANRTEDFNWLSAIPIVQIPLNTIKDTGSIPTYLGIYDEDIYCKKQHKVSIKSKLYLFLEHPEGWICFLYHFGV